MKRPQPWPKAPTPIAPVMWVDQWDCINTMSHKRAGEILKEFYDAWPCGLDEIESAIKSHKYVIDRMERWLAIRGYTESQIHEIQFGK